MVQLLSVYVSINGANHGKTIVNVWKIVDGAAINGLFQYQRQEAGQTPNFFYQNSNFKIQKTTFKNIKTRKLTFFTKLMQF